MLTRNFKVNSFVFTLLVFACIVLNTKAIADLQLGDEALYAYKGITWFATGFEADWSPLYSLWYAFLSLFLNDTIYLYFLNMALLTSLPTLAMYAFFRKMDIPWAGALYACLVFHFSVVNFPEGVKVSVFALLFLLIAIWLALHFFRKNLPKFWLVVLLILFITSYIRPEYLVVFMAIGFLYVLFGWREIGKNKWFFIGVTAAMGLVVLCVGLPLSNRGQVAFLQGITYNYVQHHGQDPRLQNLNIWMDYLAISKMLFGKAVGNAKEAFLASPATVWQYHLWPNIQDFIGHLSEILTSYIGVFVPEKYLSVLGFKRKVLWALVVLSSLLIVDYRQTFAKIKQGFNGSLNPHWLLCGVLLIAPTFSSVYSVGAVRYLVPFYVVIPLVVYGIWKMIFWKDISKIFTRVGLPNGQVSNIFFLLAFGWLIVHQSQKLPMKPLRDLPKVQYLKPLVENLKKQREVVLLGNNDQLVTHLFCKNVPYLSYKKNTDFQGFIFEKQINLLAFSETELKYYANDASVGAFLQNPPAPFRKIVVKNCGDLAVVLVR